MSENKMATKADLEEFYQRILPYLNGQPAMNYSTEEQVVGTWMGKPLYQKTVNCGNMNNTASKNVNHGISNLDSVVKLDIIWTQTGNSNKYYGNAPTTTIANAKIYAYVDQTIIKLEADNGSSTFANTDVNYYATIQYTKTTDA